MREIHTHEATEADKAIRVTADEPSHGNASHHYKIGWIARDGTSHGNAIDFQRGPVGEYGVNGLTNEVLLAIVADRLEGYQSGPFACLDNALALNNVQTALLHLKVRTKMRLERGVEGKEEA